MHPGPSAGLDFRSLRPTCTGGGEAGHTGFQDRALQCRGDAGSATTRSARQIL